MGTVIPFTVSLIISQGPLGNYAVTAGDKFGFSVYDPSFTMKMDIEWAGEIVPVTQEQIDDAYAVIFRANTPPGFNEQMSRYRKTLPMPNFCSPIVNIVTGTDGRYWVQRWGADPWATLGYRDNDAEDYQYWVFNSEGEMEYEVSLPFEIQCATEQHLFELVQDLESTPQVRRYTWTPR